MSDITIVMTTWLPPGNEKARTVASLEAALYWRVNLIYPEPVHLHIADDGSAKEFSDFQVDRLKKLWYRGEVTFSQQQRHGVGASLNAGIGEALKRSPITLYAVDDWRLLSLLDLRPWVSMLEDPNYDCGMIRFFPHPDLGGIVKHVPPHGWAVMLEYHHFVFGFRPALFHRRFFDANGKFAENVSSFDAELIYNQKVCRGEGPAIWLALPEQWQPIETGSLAGVVPL